MESYGTAAVLRHNNVVLLCRLLKYLNPVILPRSCNFIISSTKDFFVVENHRQKSELSLLLSRNMH